MHLRDGELVIGDWLESDAPAVRAACQDREIQRWILSHTAGPTADGWRVIDLWESEEAFQRFGEVIGPVLQELDYPGQRQLFELRNFVK